MLSEEDKRDLELLYRYDAMRKEFRRLEDAVERAAIEFGWRRGHIGFTRVDTMRTMLERETAEESLTA
jgi:hypothetical protein